MRSNLTFLSAYVWFDITKCKFINVGCVCGCSNNKTTKNLQNIRFCNFRQSWSLNIFQRICILRSFLLTLLKLKFFNVWQVAFQLWLYHKITLINCVLCAGCYPKLKLILCYFFKDFTNFLYQLPQTNLRKLLKLHKISLFCLLQ